MLGLYIGAIMFDIFGGFLRTMYNKLLAYLKNENSKQTEFYLNAKIIRNINMQLLLLIIIPYVPFAAVLALLSFAGIFLIDRYLFNKIYSKPSYNYR